MHLLSYLNSGHKVPPKWDGPWVSEEEEWDEFVELIKHFECAWSVSPNQKTAHLWGKLVEYFGPINWPEMFSYFEMVPIKWMTEQTKKVCSERIASGREDVLSSQALYRARKKKSLVKLMKQKGALTSLSMPLLFEVIQAAWSTQEDARENLDTHLANILIRTKEALHKQYGIIDIARFPVNSAGLIVSFFVATDQKLAAAPFGKELELAQQLVEKQPLQDIVFVMRALVLASDLVKDTIEDSPWQDVFRTHAACSHAIAICEALKDSCEPQDVLRMLDVTEIEHVVVPTQDIERLDFVSLIEKP